MAKPTNNPSSLYQKLLKQAQERKAKERTGANNSTSNDDSSELLATIQILSEIPSEDGNDPAIIPWGINGNNKPGFQIFEDDPVWQVYDLYGNFPNKLKISVSLENIRTGWSNSDHFFIAGDAVLGKTETGENYTKEVWISTSTNNSKIVNLLDSISIMSEKEATKAAKTLFSNTVMNITPYIEKTLDISSVKVLKD